MNDTLKKLIAPIAALIIGALGAKYLGPDFSADLCKNVPAASADQAK